MGRPRWVCAAGIAAMGPIVAGTRQRSCRANSVQLKTGPGHHEGGVGCQMLTAASMNPALVNTTMRPVAGVTVLNGRARCRCDVAIPEEIT